MNQWQANNFRTQAMYDGFPVAMVGAVAPVGAVSCDGFPVGSRGHRWARKHRKQRWPTVEKYLLVTAPNCSGGPGF